MKVLIEGTTPPSITVVLFEEYERSGAKIRHEPKNYPWAYEMKVEDPDGHILRFGSEPREDIPFESYVMGRFPRL